MSEPRKPARPPLVPPRVRRPAAVVAAVSAVLVLVLGIRYHDDTVAGRLDTWIFRAVPETVRSHWTALNLLVDYVPRAAIAAAVVLAVLSAALRRWNFAVLALAAPALTTALTETVKPVVDRTIDGLLSLPSGHTAGATSVLLVLALAVLAQIRRRVRTAGAVLLLAVTAGGAAVALSLVAIDAHYPTDTVAGFCTAVAVTLGLALGMDAVAGRRAGRSASASERAFRAAPAGREPR